MGLDTTLDSISARFLGAVEGLVGEAQNVGDVGIESCRFGHADADGNAQFAGRVACPGTSSPLPC